jgi:hypothetical protein
MDTFPYDSWEQAQGSAGGEGFFTFGPGDNFSTIAVVVIGFVLMIWVFVSWMRAEDRKLRDQADRLTAASRGEVM